MFKIKSFQRRILFALFAVALIPTGIVLVAGTQGFRQFVEITGTAGPWGSLADSGQELLSEIEEKGIDDPEVLAAAEAHQEALSEGLRLSGIFSLVAERFMGLVPLFALGLALLVGIISLWAARQLSRGFSRPIKDLVGWTDLIGAGEELPPRGPSEARGVQEFALLREALRKMAHELEEGRRQAIQSAKLRSWTEMARRVAHELKNPLTPMKMAAGRISLMDDPAAQEAGTVLLEEIGRLDQMARTFSQFGRMPEGPPSQIDAVELLEGLCQQHQGDGAAIHWEGPGTIPLLLGHHEALVRSFRNLLLNALDAAGPEGSVRVELRHQDGRIRVQIHDSGPGIAAQDLKRIWEPDFTTKNRGTGLGLPMVQQTILIHHGTVEGRNHPEGGAVFVVELPLEGPKANLDGEG
jgi:nitrogen fixation/metabolism regulation signal transduction histidine kinase